MRNSQLLPPRRPGVETGVIAEKTIIFQKSHLRRFELGFQALFARLGGDDVGHAMAQARPLNLANQRAGVIRIIEGDVVDRPAGRSHASRKCRIAERMKAIFLR